MLPTSDEDTGQLLRLRVFGSMEAWSWIGENVLPPNRTAQAILAYLAMCDDDRVPRQRLAGLLWSTHEARQAKASLQKSLRELADCLACVEPDLLTFDSDSVSLRKASVWIDGISSGSDMPTRAAPPWVNEFLETLGGLDPAFDQWIETTIDALRSRAADPDTSSVRRQGRRLSVVVLPILDLGSDPEAAYLPSALTREMVSALSQFRWLTVRTGTFDEAQHADYRVDGSISVQADGCRLAVRLVDCRDSERIVWMDASHLERAALQDFPLAIAAPMVERIDPEVLLIERHVAAGRLRTDSKAYECLLRAMPLAFSFERDSWSPARTLLEQAIARDSELGRAYALQAFTRALGLSQGWIPRFDDEFAALEACATRAVALDPRDTLALTVYAHIRLHFRGDFDQVMPIHKRALKLNPSCSFAWAFSAAAHGYLGQTSEAMRQLNRAKELLGDPSLAKFIESFEVAIHYCARDWPAVIVKGKEFMAQGLRVHFMLKALIGALCQVGNFDEARQYNREILDRDPAFSWEKYIFYYPFGREADRQLLAAAIARAGLRDNGGLRQGPSNIVNLFSDRPYRS